MCGGLFGGGSSSKAPATTLVSAPAATNITQEGEDKMGKALQQDKTAAKKYGASKTRQKSSTLGSPEEGVSSRPGLIGS